MKVDDKKEMTERFRLYGEIFLLCLLICDNEVDDIIDLYIPVGALEEYEIDYNIEIHTDTGDGVFSGIEFIDGMLWVYITCNESVCFTDVHSESLQGVLEVLTKYNEEL